MRQSLREAARIELGLRAFLSSGGFKGFTTTFEDLHGLAQLPGVAAQRLMADGYGFGAEGDWKTCALVRAMKVMAAGLKGGTSFMEDYTYHLDPKRNLVLGAHMLEICPSIAKGKPSLEVHPLGIGGKADPVRLVFDTPAGPALNASIMDLGNRFRLLRERSGGCRPGKAAAQAAGRPRRLGAEARPADLRRGVDLRRRRAPHRLQPGGHHGDDRGLRRAWPASSWWSLTPTPGSASSSRS